MTVLPAILGPSFYRSERVGRYKYAFNPLSKLEFAIAYSNLAPRTMRRLPTSLDLLSGQSNNRKILL